MADIDSSDSPLRSLLGMKEDLHKNSGKQILLRGNRSRACLLRSLRSTMFVSLLLLPLAFASLVYLAGQITKANCLLVLLSLGSYAYIAFVWSRKVSREIEIANNNILDLLSDLSHETASPLSSLHGNIVSLRKTETDERTSVILDRMENAYKSLVWLNQDLRVISSWGIPIKQRALSVVPLGKMARLAAEELSTALKSRNLRLTIVEDEPVAIIADESAIRRVLLNLIENSIKYSDENVDLTLVVKSENSNAKLIFRDCGPGVPDYLLERIFDRKYRVASNCTIRNEGSGLGLSIARETIESHGGSINAQSIDPSGIEFHIKLPKVPTQHPLSQLLSPKT